MAGGAEPHPQADLLVRSPGGPPLWFPPLRVPVLSPGVPFCHFDPLSSPRVPFCPIGKGSGTRGEGRDTGSGKGHGDREGTQGRDMGTRRGHRGCPRSELPDYAAIVPVLLEHGLEKLPQHCGITPGTAG